MVFDKRLVFDVMAGCASLISLFGWAGERFLDFAPDSLDYIASFVIILFFVYSIILMVMSQREYDRVSKSRDDHLLSHKISHNLRNALSKLREIEFETKIKIESAKDEAHLIDIQEGDALKVSKAFKTFGSKLADSVKKQINNNFARREIEENIRVTIKTIEPMGGNQDTWKVSTLILDPETWSSSDHSDIDPSAEKIHLIKDNTDFSKILVDEERCFYNNDLGAIGDESYVNSSPDWRKRYNSTMVIPIKNKPQSGSSVVYYGFLTVDSLNVGKHQLFADNDRDEILHIMANAADSLASWFIRYDVHVEVLKSESAMKEGTLFLAEYISANRAKEASI